MKKYLLVVIFCLLCGLTVSADSNTNKVELTKINDQIWVHTSYFNITGNVIPSYGLLAITNAGIVLVDTPWTNEQTRELLKMVSDKFNKPIQLAIFTHWHQDRIGGIDTLIAEHIETASTAATAELAVKAGFKKPQTMINPKVEAFKVGNLSFETYFPGPGHTMDNIVVYFPQTRVLYGGCLIKPMNMTNLGNTADGDVTQYPNTIREVMRRYPKAETVIANHGSSPWGDFGLLKYTLQLAEKQSAKSN
ncbi:MAG TPA: subclass B1 metallo-beta-lactamase [Firmicutes bacterium]|jgi:metallo-beta-lactamase class B|nr:subclass B1 metallo-beta-lactamase [Bacillota bacterium]